MYRDAFTLSEQATSATSAYQAAVDGKSIRDDIVRPDADHHYDGVNAFIRNVMDEPEKCVWTVNAFRVNEDWPFSRASSCVRGTSGAPSRKI